jgi:hypothetical protein
VNIALNLLALVETQSSSQRTTTTPASSLAGNLRSRPFPRRILSSPIVCFQHLASDFAQTANIKISSASFWKHVQNKPSGAVSIIYSLFVVAKNVNSFAFKQIQPLFAKHRGGVIPRNRDRRTLVRGERLESRRIMSDRLVAGAFRLITGTANRDLAGVAFWTRGSYVVAVASKEKS